MWHEAGACSYGWSRQSARINLVALTSLSYDRRPIPQCACHLPRHVGYYLVSSGELWASCQTKKAGKGLRSAASNPHLSSIAIFDCSAFQ